MGLEEDKAGYGSVEMSKFDPLTGLYHRIYFFEEAERLIRENPDKQYDMISINMDKFKLVNELYGPKTGDEFIKYIAGIVDDICPRKSHSLRI